MVFISHAVFQHRERKKTIEIPSRSETSLENDSEDDNKTLLYFKRNEDE